MASSIGYAMRNKSISCRILNIYMDIDRTFRFQNISEKRYKSFYNCAIEQLEYIINNEENACYKREAERILENFNKGLKDENIKVELLKYLKTFVVLDH